ncbi:vWA domain-containing protein [Sagittula salina]|uniref:VWA domain-containing protein n=1 Tax=Sagittula salina TaxID=2820268 RepID=A0A940MUJ2_9RHOB|nr:VWA domain-containing protein [Sagittula salina]MBP0484913.1 VWA domain-containing protein [Sagittula salina]
MRATRFPERARLARRMAGFMAHLRLNGIAVGPTETEAALAALTHVEALDPEDARRALKVLLAGDAEQWRGFDGLFDAYWFNAGRIRQGQAHAHVRTQSARPTLWTQHLGGPAEETGSDDATPGAGEGEAEGSDGRLIATRTANLSKRDLRDLMDEVSLREAEHAARALARAIRDRRSRRLKRSANGRVIDLRRTLRGMVAQGEPFDLPRRTRPTRPLRIVALCDVSGSMTVYARVFLAFLKGLLDADTSADAYLFHTRLMRVTQALRDHDSLRAATRLSLMAEGFGGGTDIGGALTTLVEQHRHALTGRTLVLILSDGYCTGSPERLAAALERLGKKTRRIVWLNPLMGWRDYAPVNAAMTAALPHLDAHLPANTLDALAQLEPEFARL